MNRGVCNGAVVAICIARVAESGGAQDTPPTAPTAPPPPPAAEAAAPTGAPTATAALTYPPPPPPDQRVYGYPPGYPYRRERWRRPRRSRGMMIAGFVLFGVSYVIPAMVGVAIGSEKDSSCDCRDAYRMLIPVAGPLTLLHGDSDYRAFNGLLVTDAVLQGAGLLLSIFGIIRYVASASEDEYSLRHPPPSWSFDAAPTPGGAYAALRLRL